MTFNNLRPNDWRVRRWHRKLRKSPWYDDSTSFIKLSGDTFSVFTGGLELPEYPTEKWLAGMAPGQFPEHYLGRIAIIRDDDLDFGQFVPYQT